MRLIATDSDGKRILDYMGQTMVLHAGPGGGQKDILVRRAYDFVLAEQKRLIEGQNAKLIPRYEALRRFVESHLPLWDVEVTKD